MDNFIFALFAAIGFAVTFVGVILGLIKLHSFFEDEFPEMKMKQSNILREIDFLRQRVHELEEKVND